MNDLRERWERTMTTACRKLAATMGRLHDRWLDEHEYEPFGDYVDIMREEAVKVFPGAVFVKGTRQPFGFIVHPVGFPIGANIYATNRIVGWRNVSK